MSNTKRQIEKSHANDYRLAIRRAIRGLWLGAIDRQQFKDAMGDEIDRGLRFAFAEGAKECGITPDDYSEAEEDALQEWIISEFEYIDDLADDVQANSKAKKGALDPLFQRAEAWILRYKDVVNRAKTMACADKKFKWVLGPTEHCATCAKLEGLVKRGSWWRDNVLPQNPDNPKLECRGFRCQCELQMTDERVSRRSPSLP